MAVVKVFLGSVSQTAAPTSAPLLRPFRAIRYLIVR